MNVAYVDSSCLVSIAFDEPGSRALARRLEGFDELYSSNLLEAELRAALLREEQPADAELLTWITWIQPDRPLSEEIGRILGVGYLRGADLWHVACALFLAETPRELTFLSLDDRQQQVAGDLGFSV